MNTDCVVLNPTLELGMDLYCVLQRILPKTIFHSFIMTSNHFKSGDLLEIEACEEGSASLLNQDNLIFSADEAVVKKMKLQLETSPHVFLPTISLSNEDSGRLGDGTSADEAVQTLSDRLPHDDGPQVDTTSTNGDGGGEAPMVQLQHDEVVQLSEEMHLSPLMTIARVVTVTSSGNTKDGASCLPSSNYSSPEPYGSGYSDEDREYVPSSVESNLSSDVSTPSSKETTQKRKKTPRSGHCHGLKSIKRTLNFENTSSNSSHVEKEGTPISSCGSSTWSDCARSTTESDETFGLLTFSKDRVELEVTTSHLHLGKYDILLRTIPANRRISGLLRGTISSNRRDHKCECVDPREPVGYVLRDDKGEIAKLTLKKCLQNGIATGPLLFMDESKVWSGFLQFSSYDVMDELDVVDIPKRLDSQLIKMKKHYCLFCKELKTCIGRHYKTQHKEEEQVAAILRADGIEGDKGKALALMKKLRLQGDLVYNRTVSLCDRIPVRKPRIQMIHHGVHCPSCGGLIAGKNLHRHHRVCSGRSADGRKRLRHLRADDRLQQVNSNANEDDTTFARVMNNMTNDELRKIIENDPLMKSYAIYIVKSQPKSHNINNVRQQLRRCARLFLLMNKEKPEIVQMKDMFNTTNYSLMTQCIRELCNFDSADEKRKSQLALAYGPIITAVVSRLKSDILKKGGSVRGLEWEELNSFETLHLMDFKVEITRQALASSRTKRMLKKQELPQTKDIQLLLKYARRIGDEAYKNLKNGFDFESWVLLGKSLLCQLLVFNRRRVGEMSRIHLRDYENRKPVSQEYYKSLTRLEIIMADQFVVVPLLAKRNRVVNILITNLQVEQLDLFISMRTEAEVSENNVYLFASPSQLDGYMKASDILRSFASQCGASSPTSLKSTMLRKHVATMSQMFCFNDNEMKQLADFLGHDRNVHENFYRLNESNTQITRLAKFLCVVGDENVFLHRGKTLDELPVDEEEEAVIVSEDELDDLHDSNLGENTNSSEPSPSDCLPLPESECDVQFSPPQRAGPSESHVQFSPPQRAGPSESQSTSSKEYALRRRSAIRRPTKFITPTKTTPGKRLFQSPEKTPNSKQTTSQIKTMLTFCKRKSAKRVKWSEQEIDIMKLEFTPFLENNALPPLSFCTDVRKRHSDVLSNRDFHSIYCWVRNQLHKRQK